jgi:hypothetical protein
MHRRCHLWTVIAHREEKITVKCDLTWRLLAEAIGRNVRRIYHLVREHGAKEKKVSRFV